MRESDLPPVDLESMNRDHRDQVELINAVIVAIEANDGSEAALRTIDEAVADCAEHTREHFRQEDDQMLRFQFPAFTLHTEAHDHATALMERVIESWRRDRKIEPLRQYFRDDFPSWLVHHVAMMDTVCAQFVAGKAH